MMSFFMAHIPSLGPPMCARVCVCVSPSVSKHLRCLEGVDKRVPTGRADARASRHDGELAQWNRAST